MEDLYKVLQVAPGVDREAIDAAYERLRQQDGGTVTADLDYAYQVLSDPKRRKVYDNARIDPRGLRALFNIEGRQEKVVWNVEGRRGEEPPPPAPPLDPWGLDQRDSEQPFGDQVELFDPLAEEGRAQPFTLVDQLSEEEEEAEAPPGQETFDWDEPLVLPVQPAAPVDRVLPKAVEPAAETEEPKQTATNSVDTPAPPKAKNKRRSTRTARGKSSRKTPQAPSQNGKHATGRPTAGADARNGRRHARTAASQLLTSKVDLEAITLTTYHPEDYAEEKPPSWWNPVNLLSLLSFTAVTLGAIGAVYYVWESSQGDGDETAAAGVADVSQLESLAAPPTVRAGDVLPSNIEASARDYVESFSGPLGERYEFLGATGSTLADGSYFYAVAARNRGSLDGTHQRLFFFVDDLALGSDWSVESLSLAEVRTLDDGRIRAVYNAYAAGDEACCPSLEPLSVYFSYDAGLVSTLAAPPPEILTR